MNTPYAQEVHGHAVMQMMLDAEKCYTRASLLEAIEAKFGKETRFHTCSDSNLSASELIDLLDAKGKFFGKPEAFQFDPATRCDHAH